MDNFFCNGMGISFGYIDTDDEETMKNITPQQLGLPANTSREQMLNFMEQQQKIMNQIMASAGIMGYSENMPEEQKNQIKKMIQKMAAQLMKRPLK